MYTVQATVKPHCMFFFVVVVVTSPNAMFKRSHRPHNFCFLSFFSVAFVCRVSRSALSNRIHTVRGITGDFISISPSFAPFCFSCAMCSALKSKSAAAKKGKKGSSKKVAKKKKSPKLSKATVSATKYLKKTRVRCVSGYYVLTSYSFFFFFFFQLLGCFCPRVTIFWVFAHVGPPRSDLQ